LLAPQSAAAGVAGGWAARTCQPDRPGHVMSLLAAAAAADIGAKPTYQPPVFSSIRMRHVKAGELPRSTRNSAVNRKE